MDTVECIRSRRSIRNYSKQSVDHNLIRKLIEDAIWAPSGKNGQPWKVKVVTNKEVINELSHFSKHSPWIRNAPCLAFVFLDKNSSYDYIKDVQSCGAFIQTMLLSAQSYGISSCWIGEILFESKKVMDALDLSDCNIELMALITLGYSSMKKVKTTRKSIDEFIL